MHATWQEHIELLNASVTDMGMQIDVLRSSYVMAATASDSDFDTPSRACAGLRYTLHTHICHSFSYYQHREQHACLP